MFSINFSKAKTKVCLSVHYNHDNSYLFPNGKEILKFKANTKMLFSQLNFVHEAYLIDLVLLSLERYFLKKMCMIFYSITMLLINLAY